MDDKLTADILATCNTIGYADGDKYYKDPECLASIKDLILYLRRDDDDHSIRRLLGKAEVVTKDLLPLLKHHASDLELFDVVLRLLVNLTNPALLVYEEEVPKNKTYRNYFHQITEHLQKYKQAFADELLWKRICERLKNLLALEWENRLENDKLAIERMLILTRNVLQVPANPEDEKRNDDDASVHDQVLYVMHTAGVFEVLLKMSSNSDSAVEYCLHIVEIISLMLREQTGEQLAKSNLERGLSEKLKDEKELMEMRAKETVHKAIQMKKLSSRHSRFGGTFAVRDMKAPSGRDLLCHKPITSVADLSLDVGKKAKKTARNRLPMSETDVTRRSTLSMRLTLQRFSERFLKTCYNFLMGLVKDRIDRSKTQDHDETYYLWAMKFFMEFNRFYKFRLEYVSETMSTGTFHYVQTLLDNYLEMMVTDKDKIPLWSKRAHSALRAYQELLYTLMWMDKCGTEAEPSRVIKKNVFYLPEYRELCYSLLLNFDPVKFSKSYFYDLMETNHLFLKMLEDYSRSSEGRIVVKVKRKKKKKQQRRKKKSTAGRGQTKKKSGERRIKMNREELEETWESISGEVGVAVLSSESPDESVNVIPFDAVSDLTIDEQKPKALERIATLLHMNKHVEAVTLLRNAREVWPEFLEQIRSEDSAAAPIVEEDQVEENEVSNLKLIYVKKSDGLVIPGGEVEEDDVDNGPVESPKKNDEDDDDGVDGKRREDEEEQEEEEDDEREIFDSESDEEDEAERFEETEQDFDFKGFLDKYAHSKILSHYGRAFQDWESLKPLSLHCIVKMFHRMTFQLDYAPLVCQLSIFKVFQQILNVPIQLDHLKEVTQFFGHLWPRFVKLCERNPKMFVEILFWKTSKDAVEIVEGYGAYQSSKKKSGSQRSNPKFNWTEVEDNELEVLAEEYLKLPVEEMKKANIVDWINRRFTSGSKVKKKIKEKLQEKGYVERVKQVRAAAKGTRSKKPRSEGKRNKKKRKGEVESIERENLLEHEHHPSFRRDSGGSSSDDDDDDGNDEEIDERINGSGRSFSSDSSEGEDSDSDGIEWKRRRFAGLESAPLNLPPVSNGNGVDQRPSDRGSVDHELIHEGDDDGTNAAAAADSVAESTAHLESNMEKPELDNEQSFPPAPPPPPVLGTADLISQDDDDEGRDTLIGEQTTIPMETSTEFPMDIPDEDLLANNNSSSSSNELKDGGKEEEEEESEPKLMVTGEEKLALGSVNKGAADQTTLAIPSPSCSSSPAAPSAAPSAAPLVSSTSVDEAMEVSE